jgi:hypothetical protein
MTRAEGPSPTSFHEKRTNIHGDTFFYLDFKNALRTNRVG